MTKVQINTCKSISNDSKRSSILSKCVAPFTAKQRSHIEQEIRLDEPFRQYAPGDRVKGAIQIDVDRPMRITHLIIRLYGFVKVSNRAKQPGEKLSYDESLSISSAGGGRRGIEYFGNGHARIFEDETVLCGEGRLHGQYQFRFETVLPSKNIPSSIDFEHGTIAYFVTSTITRPVTIAPTSVQHFKLHVQETIDIASIKKPEPIFISMEASHRKGKQKLDGDRNAVQTGSRRTSKSSSQTSANGIPAIHAMTAHDPDDPPRSPVPSEKSSTTTTTSSFSSNAVFSQESPSRIASNLSEDMIAVPGTDKVYAQTELLQGGALAGDALPIKICVRHKQPVKNMQGIIITLYRQGRIDTHPAIPIGPIRKGEKRRYEDYYPRSRTGLSGLSLSSAGSSRSFRQDLNQVFVPLIINPRSLTAVVKTSIQAPPDLFPSITAVPGAMVNFRYFIEIIVDLRGKLSGQDRIRPHLSMTSTAQHGYGDPKISKHEGSEGTSYLSTPGFNYLITDQLRRTRGVASTRTELVVGTRDSTRKRSKILEDRLTPAEDESSRNSINLGREELPESRIGDDRPDTNIEEQDGQQGIPADAEASQTPLVPLPEPEEEIDEKGRLRRAEQRLLPSEPPPGDRRPQPALMIPTAPPAADEEDLVQRYGIVVPAPAYDGPSNSVDHTVAHQQPASSITDDKQELQRQHLQTLASSPDRALSEASVTIDHNNGNYNIQASLPSAPVLFEDDIFDINDPRVPESSPADFIDDRVNQQRLLQRSESSTTGAEHGDNNVQQQPSSSIDSWQRDNNGPTRSSSQPIQGMHDENLPVYER